MAMKSERHHLNISKRRGLFSVSFNFEAKLQITYESNLARLNARKSSAFSWVKDFHRFCSRRDWTEIWAGKGQFFVVAAFARSIWLIGCEKPPHHRV